MPIESLDQAALTARIADLALDQQRHELLKARVAVAEAAMNEDFKSGPFEPDQSFQDRVRALVGYANRMSDLLSQIDMNARDDADAAIRDIAAERRRQVDGEDWSATHDDAHGRADMPRAAACYAWAASLHGTTRELMDCRDEWHTLPVWRAMWPWDRNWWKPTNPRRDLVKAGALIAAEIARLDRQSAREAGALIAAEIARLERQSAREAEAAEAPADHLAAFEPGWWRPWGGGECPKDAIGKKVDVLRRSGAKAFGTLAIGGLRAVEGSWHHRNRDDDIVAYRVRQEKE